MGRIVIRTIPSASGQQYVHYVHTGAIFNSYKMSAKQERQLYLFLDYRVMLVTVMIILHIKLLTVKIC